MLQSTGLVSTEGVCEALQTSIATVRRDLKELEDRSLLRRTRGGAVTMGPLFYEPFRHDSSFQERVGSFADEKRRIARAAARLVNEGDTVALSGGTTTNEVVRSLMTLQGITVITNTVNVAMELSACKNIEVIVTGGVARWPILPRGWCTRTSCFWEWMGFQRRWDFPARIRLKLSTFA